MNPSTLWRWILILGSMCIGLSAAAPPAWAQPRRPAPARHGAARRERARPPAGRTTAARTAAPETAGWDCTGDMPGACAALLSIDDMDRVPEAQRGEIVHNAEVAGFQSLGTRDAPNVCASRCLTAVAIQRLNTNGSADAERIGRAVSHVAPGARAACVLAMATLRNTAARAAVASRDAATDCAPWGAPAATRSLVFDCQNVPEGDSAALVTMATRCLAQTAYFCADSGYLDAAYRALAPHDDPLATLLRTFPALPGGLTGARELAVAERLAASLSLANRDGPAVTSSALRLRSFLRAAVAVGIPAGAPPMAAAANALIRLDGASAQVSPVNLAAAADDVLFLNAHGLLDDVRVASALTAVPFDGLAGATLGAPERARYRALQEALHAARDPHATLAALPLDSALALAPDGADPEGCGTARAVLQAIQRFRGSEAARVFPITLYEPLLRRVATRGLDFARRCLTAETERAVLSAIALGGDAPQQRSDFLGGEEVTAPRTRPRAPGR